MLQGNRENGGLTAPVLRMRDVYPGSRIQKQKQKRRVRKKYCPTFFAATNMTKFKIILFLNRRRKNFRPIYKEL
jgi:hypothetical protein